MNAEENVKEREVLIVGAPNVGKSTLFNCLIGRRKAIVFHQPGVTRDMIHGEFAGRSARFTVVDTGGLIPGNRETISEAVQNQVARALRNASLALFLVDGRSGVTSLDEKISLFLTRSGAKVILCVNKIDLPHMEDMALPFYSLGHGEPVCISAESRRGIDALIENIITALGSSTEVSHPPLSISAASVRIVIVGRQNVGKSSLLNALMGDERMIVSEIPGTTVDSVDSLLYREGKKYIIVDTAGIRKKKRAQEDVEKIAVIKAKQHIKYCDIVILVLDSSEGVTTQDTAIAGYAVEHWKPLLILFNKWDLIVKKPEAVEHFRNELSSKMAFLKGIPSVYVSALNGTGIHKILPSIDKMFIKYTKVIPTAELNRFIERTAKKHPIFSSLSSRTKLFYIVQAGTRPQRFIVFAKHSREIPANQKRYLENLLRQGFDLQGIPIRVEFRIKRESLKQRYK